MIQMICNTAKFFFLLSGDNWFTGLPISYSIYHIHEHLNSSHVPVLVSDFANNNHIPPDRTSDNGGVYDRIYSMVILLAVSIQLNHLNVQVMRNRCRLLMSIFLHSIEDLQLFQMVLCRHNRISLHCQEPNTMAGPSL